MNKFNPEVVLKKAAEQDANKSEAKLSQTQKDQILTHVFQNAKSPRRGFAKVTAGLAVLSSRFGPLALRAIISTLVVVLLAGGVYLAVPAPSAIGSEKTHTTEIARTSNLRVAFDSRMDKGSVEKNFTIAPPVAGAFSWNDNEVTFTPSAPLEKGITYSVTVGTGAQNFLGKNLTVPYRAFFVVKNDPEVSIVAPANQSEIKTDQTLTVIFDHPIRNLTGSLEVPEFLEFQPQIKGKYNWLGTSGFEFIPTNGWTPATDFTATVPASFTFADGAKLAAPYSWSFRTADLAVSLGGNIEHHRTKEPIELNFSFPVKVEEVMKSLIIDQIREGDTILPNSQFSFSPSSGLASKILVTPTATFKLGYRYEIVLPTGFTGGVATRGLTSNFFASFTMDESGFRVAETCPANGETKGIWDSAVFAFNNPIDPKNIKNFITVTPALTNQEVYTEGWSNDPKCRDKNDRLISIGGVWKASTKYTITLKPGIKDIYGQTLSAGATTTFTTVAYAPSMELNTYSDQGVLSSYLPRVYQARVRNLTRPLNVKIQNEKGDTLAEKDYDTNANLNVYKTVDVDLDALVNGRLPNGKYRVTFYNPDLPSYNQNVTRNIVIADTSLTVKYDNAGKLLVWATDMQSGQPVQNLRVSANNIPTQVTGTTDEQGIAILNLNAEEVARSGQYQMQIIATGAGSRYGYVTGSWSDGISPWNYNLQASYGNHINGYVGTIYTDRKIYRPDQKVFFKGVVRQDFDAKYELPKFADINVIIENPEGQRIFESKIPVSRYGSFQGDLQLDASAKLGEYRVYVNPSGDNSWEGRITGNFTVAEFRRPDFKVTVTGPEDAQIQGAQTLVQIRGEYYSGAPLGNAKATYTVTRRSLDFQPLEGEWFNFSDNENSDCYWYCGTEGNFENVISGTKNLNADGVLALTIPTNLGTFKGNAMFAVEVTLEDVNHRTVSNRLEIPVYRGEFAVGIRPNYDQGWNASSLDFDVVSVTNAGALKSGVPGTAKLYRRVWSNTQKETVDGGTTWDSTPTDTFISQSNFVTGADGRTKLTFAPDADGEYFVRLESRDSRGNVLTARASRYLYRGGSSTIRVTDDHMLKVIQNKADYNVGDTASIVVQTPYESTKALVTVERETIRDYYVIDLTPSQNTIQIPIKDNAVPNLFVSIITVKGGESKIPEFRMGYADLRVDTTNKVLDINLKSDKQTYKPGDTVTLTVNTKNRAGQGLQSEVSIAVVDERIVALMGSVDKNILGAFWFRRAIGVDTFQTLTHLIKKVFVSTGEGEGDGKGGGDSSVPIRGNFQDTAYWKADVETNANGTATVTFKLPDNLTNWQILAIGNTKNTEVGSGEMTISTRRDLTVEPLLPRFVRYGDTVKLGASVENGTGVGKNVTVTLNATNLTPTDGTVKTVFVGPKQRVGVTWNVQVPYTGAESQVTVTGVAPDVSDGYTMKLPMLPYSVPEIVTASDILQKNATETVTIPEGILTNQGDIRVAVSPNIGEGITSGVEYLLMYEYGCAEQTASALLAGTIYGELARLNLTTASRDQLQQAKDKVNLSIQKTLAMQKGNGGFGYWSDSSQTYPHLTAYVLWSLYEAKKAGFTIDQSALDRAAEYLSNYLASAPNENGYAYLGPSEKAQALFVLSELGHPNLQSYADGIYEQRASLSVFAKGFLAMSYANIKGSSTVKSSELMKDIENSIVYLDTTSAYVHENDGYDYFMSSDLRSSAITLMAYERLSPGHANTERLVRWMMRQKTGGYWQTTQNTSFALLSLIDYAKKNPVDTRKVDVTVFLNNAVSEVLTLSQGDRSKEASVTYKIQDLLVKGNTHQFGLEKDTDKRYFYDISMKVFRQIEDIQPFENGFTVISDYYKVDDVKHVTPISEAKPGDTIRVRMKLIVPKRHQYVAFEHHLPTGLEAVDLSLNTSNQALQTKPDQNSWEYNWWWENAWSHTELRDDRAFLFAEDLQAGVYEYEFFAQAVTPGEFRVPPARAYEMYTPSANGHNEGKIFRVR